MSDNKTHLCQLCKKNWVCKKSNQIEEWYFKLRVSAKVDECPDYEYDDD